jgi:hypothetical protein
MSQSEIFNYLDLSVFKNSQCKNIEADYNKPITKIPIGEFFSLNIYASNFSGFITSSEITEILVIEVNKRNKYSQEGDEEFTEKLNKITNETNLTIFKPKEHSLQDNNLSIHKVLQEEGPEILKEILAKRVFNISSCDELVEKYITFVKAYFYMKGKEHLKQQLNVLLN